MKARRRRDASTGPLEQEGMGEAQAERTEVVVQPPGDHRRLERHQCGGPGALSYKPFGVWGPVIRNEQYLARVDPVSLNPVSSNELNAALAGDGVDLQPGRRHWLERRPHPRDRRGIEDAGLIKPDVARGQRSGYQAARPQLLTRISLNRARRPTAAPPGHRRKTPRRAQQ